MRSCAIALGLKVKFTAVVESDSSRVGLKRSPNAKVSISLVLFFSGGGGT